jgi:methylmalonyl-CoA/ethylmalonyl-CoA epimerase
MEVCYVSFTLRHLDNERRRLLNLRQVRHIDYVVRNLDRAVAVYQGLFKLPSKAREHLDSRGVIVARFRLANVWINVVEPISQQNPGRRHLDQHGEGFFQIAYEVKDLDGAGQELNSRGIKLLHSTPRRELEGWRLLDIAPSENFGVPTQLAQGGLQA